MGLRVLAGAVLSAGADGGAGEASTFVKEGNALDLADIWIRDSFTLPVPETGWSRYGTASEFSGTAPLLGYRCRDLHVWAGSSSMFTPPEKFWAEVLFRASDAIWGLRHPYKVTDGSILHRTATGVLLMFWSDFGPVDLYKLGLARWVSGTLEGSGIHEDTPFVHNDGAHGMLSRDFSGRLKACFHQPNRHTSIPRSVPVREEGTPSPAGVGHHHPAPAGSRHSLALKENG